MKAMVITASLILAGLSAGALEVPVTVQESTPEMLDYYQEKLRIKGRARTDAPLTVGIPLRDADGIKDVKQLGLKGAKLGQFRALNRYPSGNIQWVLIDTQASLAAGKTAAFTLVGGKGNFGGDELAVDGGKTITVDTGAAVFTIRKSKFDVLGSVKIAGREMLKASGGAIVSTDAAGVEYRSSNDPASKVMVEENGPVRAVIRAGGRLTSAAGKGHLWYTARLYFYRGKTRLRMDLTLRNDSRGLPRAQKVNRFEIVLPLKLSGKAAFAFAGRKPDQIWSGQVAADGGAKVFQGFSEMMTDNYVRPVTSSALWPKSMFPLPAKLGRGRRGGRGWVVEKRLKGLKVFNGKDLLHGKDDPRDYTRGWADFSGADGAGVTAAIRWMAALWPASLESTADGTVTVGLFARHNPKAIQINWGCHITRQVTFDFHAGKADAERALYALQFPLIARAAIEQYRSSGAIFNRTELATAADEAAMFKKHGARPLRWPNRFNVVVRRVHYRRNYIRWEDVLLHYLKHGKGGDYLQAEQFLQYTADKPFAHSAGFDLSKAKGLSVSRNEHTQNPFDWAHQQTAGLPLYYYMSGDERFREAIADYAEYVLSYSARRMPAGIGCYRAWLRAVRNNSWLFDFTGDRRHLDVVHRSMDYFIDGRADPKNVRKPGRSLERGYYHHDVIVSLSGAYGKGEMMLLGKRLGQIFGELGSQLLHLHKKHPDHLGYKRLEDFEDAFLGVAQFTWREAGKSDDPKQFLLGHDYFPYNYGRTVKTKRYSRSYPCSAQASLLYHMFGRTRAFKVNFHIPFNCGGGVAAARVKHLQHQVYYYIDTHRPPPRWGWKDVPDVTVRKTGSGTYTLTWKAPPGVKAYKIKHSGKPIVDWLGYDLKTGKYEHDPAEHTAFFAARNVADEPEPSPAGGEQKYTFGGADAGAGGKRYFSVKYSTTYTGNWSNIKGIK